MRGAGLRDCADGGGHHLLPAPHVGFDWQPDDNQIFNNHIPVDPYVEEKISITKTSPLINVTRGQLVPYTITFKNTLRSTLPPLGIVDTMPAGFKYVEGSSRIDEHRA